MKIHQKSGGNQWNIIKTVQNISSVSVWKTSQVELSFSEELQTFPMIVSKIPLGNGEFSYNLRHSHAQLMQMMQFPRP